MRVLSIDLSDRSYRFESIDLDRSKYPGGKVLGLYLLLKNLEKDPIYITTGTLEGLFPGAARAGMHAISPLTGIVLDSYAGGKLGTYLRSLNIDAIEIVGESEDPVYVVVHKDGAEFHDAKDLRGKGIYETTKILSERHRGSIAAIGPAGENLVKYAVVMVDRDHAFGRSGSGAQFGKRKLKALVVSRASTEVKVYDRDEYREVIREITKRSKEMRILREHGTQATPSFAASVGQIPVKNFYTTRHKEVDKISGDAFKRFRVRSESCLPCAIGCRKITKINDVEVSGPEYETIAMTGSNNLVFDPRAIIENGYLCNDLGLDTISTGNVIGRYMERLERYKGVKRRGDHEFQKDLIIKIAYRKDVGDILAEGVKRASEILGGTFFAVHVKGLEAPARDPRGRLGAALSYATADVGASHLRGFPDREPPRVSFKRKHVESLIKNRDRKYTKDSLIVCTFVPRDRELANKAFHSITGKELDPLIGRRAENLGRLINLRLKPDLKDDIPPRRWEPVPDGPAKGMKAFKDEEEFRRALMWFYEMRLRDENGRPTEESLRKTSLEEFLHLIK